MATKQKKGVQAGEENPLLVKSGLKVATTLEANDGASPELVALRSRVAELEKEKQDRDENSEDDYMKEIIQLRRKSKTSLNEIKYKEIAPETISLWHVSGHNVGKRVGPVMLEQGEETYLRFRTAGIKLSAKRPTEEWIARYKETEEYKKSEAAEIHRRSYKDRSRKESEVDKLTKAVATMAGIPANKLNSIAASEGDIKTRDVSLLNSVPKV